MDYGAGDTLDTAFSGTAAFWASGAACYSSRVGQLSIPEYTKRYLRSKLT
jgi:hypothetical protein